LRLPQVSARRAPWESRALVAGRAAAWFIRPTRCRLRCDSTATEAVGSRAARRGPTTRAPRRATTYVMARW